MCPSSKKTIGKQGTTGQSASLQSLESHGMSAFGLTKEKKVSGNSQYQFIKSKLCLINLIAFSQEMIAFVHKGKGMDIIYFAFSKASDMVSHYTCVSEFGHYGLEVCTTRQVKLGWLV